MSQPVTTSPATGSMRERMPVLAAWIDSWRNSVFGREWVDTQIRAGMRGAPTFYASENGHEVGTPFPGTAVQLSDPPKRKP